MREQRIEQYLVKKIERIGGLCPKFSSPGCNGYPDRLVIYRGNVDFVELKTNKGRISKIQAAIHLRLKARGARVYVLSSVEDVQHYLHVLQLETSEANGDTKYEA